MTFFGLPGIHPQTDKQLVDSTADELLMLRVRHGEVEILGVLYERHRAPLLNFFVRLTGNLQLAEDLVQDVFLRMLKYRHTFEQGNRFTTWMYQIGRNTLYNAWRKRGPETSLEAGGVNGRETLVCPGLAPDATLRQTQEIALLQKALAALPLESREVLVLSRFQNLMRGNCPHPRLRSRRRENARASRAQGIEDGVLPLCRKGSVMKCERVNELFADYLAESLDPRARTELDAHLTDCAACREETGALLELWTKLSSLPEEKPSRALDDRFHTMLGAYREGMEPAKPAVPASTPRTLEHWLECLWPRRRALQLSFAVLLFALGLVIGPLLARVGHRGPETAAPREASRVQLRDEVSSLKQLVTLSLLQQQSASERLRGVESSQDLERPDAPVLSALLRALDSDANVNVRLAAVDALQPFARNEIVKKGLLDSLPRQSSPLVQIELINLMVKLKASESVPALKSLLQNNAINEAVRQRARWGLEQLG